MGEEVKATFEWDTERECYKTIPPEVEEGEEKEEVRYFNVNCGKITFIPTEDPLKAKVIHTRSNVVRKQEMYGAGDLRLNEVMAEEIKRAAAKEESSGDTGTNP